MIAPGISLTWSDVADIVVAACIIYGVLVLIRGTRAVQILQGLLVLVLLRLVAQALHLWTVLSMLNVLLIAAGVAIPIVFQPEIRRVLAQLGRAPFFDPSSKSRRTAADLAGVLGQVAAVLSRSAIGAIVVVERNTGLAEYEESGRRIDARLSAELLLSIFAPPSPLHDGAVIVRGSRIAAAGCFLPLSEMTVFERRLGTRHRAALGITEQTDAVALVVSEETGGITLARDGRLSESLETPDGVTAALARALARPAAARPATVLTFLRALWPHRNGAADELRPTQLRP